MGTRSTLDGCRTEPSLRFETTKEVLQSARHCWLIPPHQRRASGRLETPWAFLPPWPPYKSLVVIAVEVEGKSIGRIRLRSIADASAASLHSFSADAVEPGSTLHTDGWPGYQGLEQKGYLCETSVIGKQPKDAVKLLPHVHLIVALLKRWLMGTHQGAVSRVY